MLAYLAVAIAAVAAWEVGRLLFRAARPIPKPAAPVAPPAPPPAEVADARAEAAALLAPGDPGDGWTVFRYACHDDEEGVDGLSPARRAWLYDLTLEEVALLRRCMPDGIGRHMDRRTTIRGVRHVQPLQPVLTLRDLVELASGGGGRGGSGKRRKSGGLSSCWVWPGRSGSPAKTLARPRRRLGDQLSLFQKILL
ncbi:hypothetical protein [Methylobacterium platani]|uniref:Uncharacterized protein n=2 Tax=Methylobacterium platani TaxID=427683 RepID=A0A179SDB4_9HYPH|nr:hypothetical protein [Methylobacterium platani]KMO16020.1 hypothetical protein SQ03_15740 [Methylobacterium platani JCM 14648]OAS24844.1 hypothetical protein A5481_12170 [Methylobacterium platani]